MKFKRGSARHCEDIVRLYRNIKIALGVSATHLDWTMVPYVKKSFKKHYKNGLKYLGEWWSISEKPEEVEKYLGFEFEIDNDECIKYAYDAYKYALDMTTKETYQAVEGMFHNLNTLQSRSGNQLK